MFLCNSSILPGVPLRPCWNVWQTKAFVAILMQINCMTHNLVFHSPLLPQGHNHSLWGLTSCLEQEQLLSALLFSASRRRKRRREGLRARHPAKHIGSKMGRRVRCAAPRLSHLWWKHSQAPVTFLPMIQLQLTTCIFHPTRTSTAEDPSHQLSWWEEHL